MAYITIAKLKDRLGLTLYARLTDRMAGAAANDTVGQQIIDQAEAEMNSHLSARFQTPLNLASQPELTSLLESRALDLAEHVAWRGSPFVGDVPDRVRQVYDSAIAWLLAVARGEVELPSLAASPLSPVRDASPRVSARDRTFTAEELDGL